MSSSRLVSVLAMACVTLLTTASAYAQLPLGTAFSFQGELRLQNVVVNSPTDFVFQLYDQPAAGTLIGSNTLPNVPVSRGVFSVDLDYGAAAFAGDRRWVEIRVRNPAGAGVFVTLNPRVELRATPNALFARSIGNNSVNSAKIVNGSISNADLSDNLITSAKIFDGAVTAADIAPSLVSSVDGVVNDGGNIDLVAGANVTITPNDAANTITIAASGNAGTLDGLDSTSFLRSNTSDVFTAGALTTASGTTLNVDGTLDVGGAFNAADGTTLVIQGTPANFAIAGANLELDLADSGADTVRAHGAFEVVDGQVFLNADGPDADSTIFIYNNASSGGEALQFDDSDDRLEWTDDLLLTGTLSANCATATTTVAYNRFGAYRTPIAGQIAGPNDLMISEDLELGGNLYMQGPTIQFDVDSDNNSIIWQEFATPALSGCTGTTGAVASAFEWNVTDNASSGWAFTNGTDVEFVVDDVGSLGIDGSLNTSGGCDLAETFLGPDDLEAGTVVRADPNAAEAVLASNVAYDPMLVGVVSTRPALVMNGPTRDAEPLFRRLSEVREVLRANPEDPTHSALKDDLERALDTWARGDVKVALVGRVPVKVTGSISAGEPLTSSPLTGHAMAMERPGPSIGIALESKSGAGTGVVMALVQPGWRSPVAVQDDVVTRVAASTGDESTTTSTSTGDAIALLTTRLDSLEAAAGRDGVDGDGGEDGAGGEVIEREVDGALRPEPQVDAEHEGWADFDGDGLVDVAVLDADGRLSLRRNVGDGSFQDVTGALHHDPTTVLIEVEWIDYDADRLADLHTRGRDGAIVLHHNLGSGTFEARTLRPGGPASVSPEPARIADLEAKLARLTKLVESLTATRPEGNR